MPEMNIIFDTNAYRLFCDQYIKPVDQEEKQRRLHRLRECEQAKNITSHLNLFVLSELLKHLVSKEDAAYYRCLQAIQVTFWHTKRNGSVNFIPPPEFEICHELFSKLPQNFDNFLNRLGGLYSEIIKDPSDDNLEKFKPAFSEIASWIDEYKQSFISSYSAYLNSEDPLNACNWKILIKDKDKDKRKAYIRHLNKEDRRTELAMGLILFIGKHLDFHVEMTTDEFIKKAEKIKNDRKIGFELMLRILKLFLNGDGYNLSSGNRPNDIIDFLFALSLDSTKSRILVSEDKDLRRMAAELSICDKVMSLGVYLDSIDFVYPRQ